MQDVMTIEREWFTDKSTEGRLMFDGVFFCFTLEDTCRRQKVHGSTAIPSGRYEIVLDYSTRFKKIMPHLLNVPKFEGIRIHSGNTSVDTDGCILVGMKRGLDVIYESRRACELVMNEIEARLKKGPVYVAVVGGISKDQFEA